MTEEFQNKRVLITGSSRGIGYKIAEWFVSKGAKVILNGRNKKDLGLAARKLNINI